jgi:MFS family permease
MDEEKSYPAYRWLVLATASLSLIVYSLTMIAYAPMLSKIAEDLRVDMAACLNLSMVFLIVVAFCNTFGGALVDRLGLTVIYVGTMLAAGVPAVLLPWIGHDYTTVFLIRLIQGPCAIAFCTAGPILAFWFPQREHGLAGGIMMCMMSIGSAIGVVLFPLIFSAVGTWQTAIAIGSIPAWITLFLAILVTRRRPPLRVDEASSAQMQSASEKETYGQILREPTAWFGLLILFFSAWGFYTLYNVVPAYLASPAPIGLGLGSVTAGRLSLLMIAIGALAMVLGGLFYDKVARGGSRSSVLIGFALSGLLTYTLVFPAVNQNRVLLGSVLILSGFGFPFMLPSMSAFVVKNYPAHVVGGIIGLWFGLGTLGGAAGIYVAGLLTAATGSFEWGIKVISLAAAAGFMIGFTLKPRAGRYPGRRETVDKVLEEATLL